MNLAVMGGLARGLSDGVSRYQDARDRDLQYGASAVRTQREQARWAREDAERADMDAAEQAASRALQDDRTAYESKLVPTLGGMQPQTHPYRPDPQALLRAAQAKTDELFRRGKTDLGFQQWSKVEQVRSQMRGQAGQRLMQTMATGGDITSALRELDSTVDDGLEIESVKRIRGPNGETAYEIRHKNRLSGQVVEQPSIATAQDMQMRVAQLLADPKKTAEFSYRRYQENLEANNSERLERLKQAGRLGLADAQFNYDLQLKRTPSAGSRDFNLGPGQTRFTAGPEGKPVPVANVAPSATGTSGERAALVQERLAAEKRIDQILKEIESLRGPEGRRRRPALDRELADAKADAAGVRGKLANFGGGQRGATRTTETARAPNAEAQQIKADMRAGRISRDEAIRRLQRLGYE